MDSLMKYMIECNILNFVLGEMHVFFYKYILYDQHLFENKHNSGLISWEYFIHSLFLV